MTQLKKYENGLTLIVTSEKVLSTSIAIMVKAGCVNETEKNNGISHYIEHMNFKGTDKLTAFDISNKLEYLGSNFNAYTGMEVTCYHAQALPENVEKTFEIMSNMVFNSTYLDEEASKEKGVIIEEIKMSEDSPDDVCTDLISSAYYGNDGYGRTILGSESNVTSFQKADVLSYLNDYYVASNMVVSFAGVITLDEADAFVKKYVLPYVLTNTVKEIPKHNVTNLKQSLCKHKEIEQSHIALAFPSHSSLDEDNKIASDIAVSVLGGGMSSRLFLKVREELGLAYSVYSYCSRFFDCGTFNVYAGVSNENVDLAYSAILETIENAKKGISDDEFEKVRNQFKANTLFSQERSSIKARFFAKYYLLTGKIYDFDERINALNKVSKSQVVDVLNALNTNDMSAAIVGNGVKPIKF